MSTAVDALAAGVVVLADTQPEDWEVSPGLVGFVATFLLALAVIALMLFFVRDLRKVNRAFARRDGTSATSTTLSNDRNVESSIGSPWPYADGEAATEADRAARIQGGNPESPASSGNPGGDAADADAVTAATDDSRGGGSAGV